MDIDVFKGVFGTITLIFAFVLGFGMGSQQTGIVDDCMKMGRFRVLDKAFTCAEAKP